MEQTTTFEWFLKLAFHSGIFMSCLLCCCNISQTLHCKSLSSSSNGRQKEVFFCGLVLTMSAAVPAAVTGLWHPRGALLSVLLTHYCFNLSRLQVLLWPLVNSQTRTWICHVALIRKGIWTKVMSQLSRLQRVIVTCTWILFFFWFVLKLFVEFIDNEAHC